jgi:deoxyribonuclease IV
LPGPDERGIDELGAHVSVAGGVDLAPERAREIGAVCLQLFTKQPNRWLEPAIPEDRVEAFRRARGEKEIRVAVAHDSYLINLSSPDPTLWKRSCSSFRAELDRCLNLGLDFVVTHPGNATDGDLDAGIRRNAEGVSRALHDLPGDLGVLLELTAGSGTSVGGSFEHLRRIMDLIDGEAQRRVGICFDTCHAFAAGYDLIEAYEPVFEEFDSVIGLEHLRLFHLNDSVGGLGSHRDRHAGIGQGELGEEPFRRLMTDDRFREVPKILETPKGDDPVRADKANLERLREMRVG